jgi:hypothetical protein
MKQERYRLTKLSPCTNPVVPSAGSMDEYRKSLDAARPQDQLSPSVDYWIEGTLLNRETLKVGEYVSIARDTRNGVRMPGIMTTTNLTEIIKYDDGSYRLTTQNSVYLLEPVKEKSDSNVKADEAKGWADYRRAGVSSMRPYVDGEDLSRVSISQADIENGSPKKGDMIARNPKDHSDMWLVAEKYFKENLIPIIN